MCLMPVHHTRFWIGVDILRNWADKAKPNSSILYYKGFIAMDLMKKDEKDLQDAAKSANFMIEQLYMGRMFDPVQRKLAPGYYEYYLQCRQSRDRDQRFWHYGREIYKEINNG